MLERSFLQAYLGTGTGLSALSSFPHHLAVKTCMNMVGLGLQKIFPQMSFHACTHDMLHVGCHVGMLGGMVELPANAETLHL
jgi:hypothetical protein